MFYGQDYARFGNITQPKNERTVRYNVLKFSKLRKKWANGEHNIQAKGGIGMYFMFIRKLEGETDDRDLEDLRHSFGLPCDDLSHAGSSIKCTLKSADHVHRAVLNLTRNHKYAQRASPWKIGGSPDETEANELARECDPGQAIISEALYHKLDPSYRSEYQSPQRLAGYDACRTRPRGQPRCFCVLPIGLPDSEKQEDSNFVFERLITPACQELGYLPVHPLKQHGSDIWAEITNSLQAFEHVVVYLGSSIEYNPNVMLELGYRLATGKPLVVVGSTEGKLPFDLLNYRTVLIPPDLESGSPDKIRETVQGIIDKMKDRACNDLGWGSLHATATIEIDTRRVPDNLRDNKISEASKQTASLFSIPLEELIGMSPGAIMGRLEELMDANQYKAFQDEQEDLYAKLGCETFPIGRARPMVRAKIPIVLTKHPDQKYFLRAYLPVVLSKEQIGDRSLYRIVYVEASQHIKQNEKNVCYVPDPAPNLEVVFAKYAGAYDQVLSELPNYQEVIERHCEFITPSDKLKVLDLGAGTGNLTIKLLEKGACVTAVDRSNEMIRVLRRKCSTYQRNLKTYTIDASNLSFFESNSFDVVNILLVLFAIEEPENVLREAFRVLRPGGKLVMTEPKFGFVELISGWHTYCFPCY